MKEKQETQQNLSFECLRFEHENKIPKACVTRTNKLTNNPKSQEPIAFNPLNPLSPNPYTYLMP